MATLDLSSVYTIADIAKTHQNKTQLEISLNLHRKNGVLRFAGWEMANMLTSHVFSKEVGLPDATERAIGEGSTAAKPQISQGTEALAYIESRSEIDIIMQRIKGAGFAAWRYAMDMIHSEGLGQGMATRIFYGAGTPGKIRGLNVRYGTLNTVNCFSAGGAVAAANTSLWVIQPGFGKFNLLYGEAAQPGSPTGEFSEGFIRMQDMGLEPIITSTTTGALLHKYVTLFDIFMGMCVYDDRAVQRLANINTTTGAGEVDPDQVIQLIQNLPDPEGERYIFGNRTAIYQLKKNVQNKTVFATLPDKYGQLRDFFYNTPIVLTEALTNVEAVVS
jgi:hypothetical protein